MELSVGRGKWSSKELVSRITTELWVCAWVASSVHGDVHIKANWRNAHLIESMLEPVWKFVLSTRSTLTKCLLLFYLVFLAAVLMHVSWLLSNRITVSSTRSKIE